MDLEEIDINGGNWVDSAQDRDYWRVLVNTALNLWVPQAMELVSLLVRQRSPNAVTVIKYRRLRWRGHVARMEKGGGAFNILTGRPTGKRSLGGSRQRWEDNIRMGLAALNLQVP